MNESTEEFHNQDGGKTVNPSNGTGSGVLGKGGGGMNLKESRKIPERGDSFTR